ALALGRAHALGAEPDLDLRGGRARGRARRGARTSRADAGPLRSGRRRDAVDEGQAALAGGAERVDRRTPGPLWVRLELVSRAEGPIEQMWAGQGSNLRPPRCKHGALTS